MLISTAQDTLYERLGELIKEARDNAGVKQELLAEYLDLTRVSISNIENGKQKIQLHTLLEIAKYLHIPISNLLNPLMDLIADNVSTAIEKRIIQGAEQPIKKGQTSEQSINNIKGFVNFAKTKNSTD